MSETPKRNIWNIMSSAVKKDFYPTPKEIDNISSFLFLRYISNHPYGCMVANAVNEYSDLPNKNQYIIVRALMPHGVKYIQYPSKAKVQDKETVNQVMEFYKCSQTEAIQYLKILNEEDIKEIKTHFVHGLKG